MFGEPVDHSSRDCRAIADILGIILFSVYLFISGALGYTDYYAGFMKWKPGNYYDQYYWSECSLSPKTYTDKYNFGYRLGCYLAKINRIKE